VQDDTQQQPVHQQVGSTWRAQQENCRHRIRILAMIPLLLAAMDVRAGMCPAPPVVTVNQALCLARDTVERPSPPPWQVDYRIFKTTKGWSVRFEPRRREELNGRGELFIEAQSGRVRIIRMDR